MNWHLCPAAASTAERNAVIVAPPPPPGVVLSLCAWREQYEPEHNSPHSRQALSGISPRGRARPPPTDERHAQTRVPAELQAHAVLGLAPSSPLPAAPLRRREGGHAVEPAAQDALTVQQV